LALSDAHEACPLAAALASGKGVEVGLPRWLAVADVTRREESAANPLRDWPFEGGNNAVVKGEVAIDELRTLCHWQDFSRRSNTILRCPRLVQVEDFAGSVRPVKSIQLVAAVIVIV
jgi:hypothetical protein